MISECRAAGKGAENKFRPNWVAVFKHSESTEARGRKVFRRPE